MRITLARPPTLAHPDFKPQEVEAHLSGINSVGLALVKREVKSFQYMPNGCQGRVYFAPAQHHKVVRITDDARL